ncbi:hypothetical protein B0H17DRAFT_1221284 [Mycena rosella]|uniref:CxC2-like cysteine cluster KDZ transposase-associated domain-containing protein n=1 Tax=Mycena rosella TaxID=1033263 RepID=A0AAD7B4P0_MYCRO|nr:hypothetical protein B0H17DRAFT_1221284 [Mycena rosella]
MGRSKPRPNYGGQVNGPQESHNFTQSGSFSGSSNQLTTTISRAAAPRPSKKRKKKHVPDTASAPPVAEEEAEEERKQITEGTSQGASVMMKAFLAVEDQLKDAIFSTKTHASLEGGRAVKCACGKEEAKFRCLGCRATNMVCAACLVKMHPDQNFHHVEEWDGSGFVRTPLWTLGHELHLAHGGLKLTNNAFPHKVQDWYRELLRVYRVWRRRTGQAQNIDAVITNRWPGSLAVRCPACPEVGVNIDKATLDTVPADKRHTVTLFLSSDGNFKLQRKRKVDDPDDFALNGGNAYFPEDTQYKLYVSELGPEDDKCTCSELKAVCMQNITKFKNAVVTGVVAVQCACHGFFQPGGLVDLTTSDF